MKKTLALVLALAMVFSTITVAFAEGTLGEDAQICADLGMLQGETGTVDEAYVATAPTRLQAAIMFLRLKGLEAEALAFTGEDNFADGEIAWAEGANLIAYLKANPQLGWIGDGTNFNPTGAMTAQAYYKVMLEALGYKQTTAEVAGDFEYADVFTFAASVGLSKVADVENFTVNDLAIATVEALKINVKGTEKTLAASLVEAGVIDEAKAVAAGLAEPAVVAPTVAVDEVMAVGNTEVDVTFEDDVDASVANVANFTIEGLEVLDAAVVDSDTIRLTTSAMTKGKIYTLTVGEDSVKFAGIEKVTGAPEIEKVVSEDIEEVVITFTKNIDLATGSDVANYSIAGIEIVKAEVEENEVTLTTVGLKNKTKYTVKVTGIKSVDGATKRSDSDSFTSKFDTVAPKIDSASAETNQRIVVLFNEKVTEESATDLANYALAVDEKDGDALEILEIKYITTGDDKEKKVELITEPMEYKEEYELTVSGLVDQRKAANTMTRPSKVDGIKGPKEDESAPKLASAVPLSPTSIMVTFTDDSRIDEDSATDLNNYELEDLDIDDIVVIENKTKIFRAVLTVEAMDTGEGYDLTVDGIQDEFGNILEDKKETIKPKAGDIAAVGIKKVSGVYQVYATAKNKIVVEFDNEVDEASAEDISNYKVNEGIGAPTKAEFEKTGAPVNSVTLTVNELVNGFEDYELTVDGVLDLAGNELFYEEIPVITNLAQYKWDKTVPELEGAEALNNKVVALEFDEMVKYKDGAELWLIVNGDESGHIDLAAADTDEDDTIVEFTYAAGTLDATVELSVYKIVYDASSIIGGAADEDGGICDLIGNSVLMSHLALVSAGDKEFDGTDEAAEELEYDDVTQIDGKTFEVKFPRLVKFISGGTSQSTGIDVPFTATYKSTKADVATTGDDEIRFMIDGDNLIQEDVDYKFDLAALLADLHGTPVANDDEDLAETVFTGEYEDEDAPYIDEVVAVNRFTIKVTFNERMDESTVIAGDFELWNYDLDDQVTGFSLNDVTDNDGVIELVLPSNKPLEGRYEYQLTLEKASVKDVAGIPNESEEVHYFDGSNLK